jgi:hypothetical protein
MKENKVAVNLIVTAVAAVFLYIVFKLATRQILKGQIEKAVKTTFLGDMSLPRGIRNNNPGNLIKTSIPWQGKVPHDQNSDSRFEQFQAFKWGTRAMIKDLHNDINKGATTLRSLIHEYAPPFENHTETYIEWVSNEAGLNPEAPLYTDKDTTQKLVQAIARYENGAQKNWISDADFEAAWSLL